ncbi:hypothetical protein EDD16DRAFT_1522535 [Pisolithus croceorrhizus]|nr:hypothetical protein EDD16DRAFT_1522535 [Pisolithus croceorrhizus]KAI6167771.1 hypothetical protein EDD17DRAFT_1503988 [Pisolithus thermaeus]
MPFSLLHLASIPAALRHKMDWAHVAMDPMVGKLFIKNQQNYFPMEQVFKNLVDKGLYNEQEQHWLGVPSLSAMAATVVIKCISEVCGTVKPARRWTGDLSTCPLKGGDVGRKPDMSCWLAPGSEFDWRHLATFAKVKNCGGKANEKSSYTETAAPCFCILGSSIHSMIFDHGGSLSTCSYDINSKLLDFMCILISITSAPHEILGFDASTTWEWQQCNGKTVGVKALNVWEDNTELSIELDRVLFISDNLFSRGTMVWGGMIRGMQARTREPVVMKDSWIDPLQKYTEGRILFILNVHKIKGVLTLVHEQQVKASSLSAVANPTVNHSTHFL